MTGEFRQFLFPHDHPRLAEIRGLGVYDYHEAARTPGTFTGGLIAGWQPLYKTPFRGITEDGTIRADLFPLTPAPPGEEAPVEHMVSAARALLDSLDPVARQQVRYPLDAVEWQTWANPEFLQFDTGLRLEFQPQDVRCHVLALMRASLSPAGFELAHSMMLINGFLGELIGLEAILNEWSYNFAIYGDPHPVEPWGWQLYGHHCALNCVVVHGRMIVSPVFLGAEPDEIDEGSAARAGLFADRINLGLALMRELPAEQRRDAIIYQDMVDPAMPRGRVHPGDERHLGGAFQDNRVIPFEGVRVTDMPPAAQRVALQIAEAFVGVLPDGPRRTRMREITEQLGETWFSWIGGSDPGDVFYYRLQSPVLVAELDHHCGVFLDYDTPKPFHIHTVMRTPHGNDYGRSYVLQAVAAMVPP